MIARIPGLMIAPALFGLLGLLGNLLAPCEGAIKAGASQRDITPPVGLEIQHFYRISEGVHDPLFARCLYLEYEAGTSVAIVCLDLVSGGFEACDSIRGEIREKLGVQHTLLNFSHNHSSAALGPRGRTAVSNDTGSKWNDSAIDAIVAIVGEAKQRALPVTLRTGRAEAHVGFNRRLVNRETGHVFMGVNRDGPVVPWVNVLVAESKQSGKPISVLLETAGHPVIVPHTTKKISADYPGAAVNRVREELGDEVVVMFGQGCGGNINGFPLRSSYENAVSQGRKLGESCLKAVESSQPIKAETLRITELSVALPTRPFPTNAEWKELVEANQADEARVQLLKKMKDLMDRGGGPPARRLDASAIMLGDEWCLVALPHEMFCEYELWIDKHAPFKRTMTFGYTNGYQGYVAVDEAWRMGGKGGYEAASLPNWGGQVMNEFFGPPAVGCEKIIKDAVISLWKNAE